MVSDLTLGTFEWGRRVDVETAKALVSTYASAGGTLLELPATQSGAESVVGSLSVPSGVRVAARVGIVDAGGQLEVSLSRETLITQVEALRATVNREVIDVLILDAFDSDTPVDETADAVRDLRARGHITYVAAAHHTAWQLAVLAQAMPVCAVLSELSLLHREAESALVPAAEYLGLGVFAGASLGRGVLTGRYTNSPPRDSRVATESTPYAARYLAPAYAPVLKGVGKAASALGVKPVDIALAWNRGQGVTSSLVAPRTVEQLEELLASDLVLEPEIADALNQISS